MHIICLIKFTLSRPVNKANNVQRALVSNIHFFGKML